MLREAVVVHLRKNSPKRPNARFSIYLQRHRQGISFRLFGKPVVYVRYSDAERIRWVKIWPWAIR